MVYGQEKLLTPKQEEIFKRELKSLRDKGFSAKQIAKALHFGEPDSPYEKLKSQHVYFYVEHFNLSRKIKKRAKININDIKPEYRHLYFKYIPGMPECVAENMRRDGRLLNDPLDS